MTFSPEVARAMGGPSWLAERRMEAIERWNPSAKPSSSEEIWRYSRIDSFDLDRYRPIDDVPTAGTAGVVGPIDQVTVDALPGLIRAAIGELGERAALVVVRNGSVVLSEVDESLTAKGVVVGDLAASGDAIEHLGSCSDQSRDYFVDLHDAFLSGGAFVKVPKGVVVERPILIFNWAEGDGLASFPHTLVVAEENSELTVLDYHASGDDDHLVAGVVEVVVEDAARVNYLNLQAYGPRVWQVTLQRSHVGRDSSLRGAAVALGGDYARMRTESLLHGKGASSEMVAVYFAGESQMLDFRTLQDHDAPNTTSNLLFKGAVEDEARSVYSGLIRLRPTAQRAVAAQTNRNLVLSPGSGAESIPNLEIEANDVRCSHASAVGPIDEEQLYYLATRGIPPEDAERMIVFGFFEDVIERLPIAALARSLRAAVTEKFSARAMVPGGPNA